MSIGIALLPFESLYDFHFFSGFRNDDIGPMIEKNWNLFRRFYFAKGIIGIGDSGSPVG